MSTRLDVVKTCYSEVVDAKARLQESLKPIYDATPGLFPKKWEEMGIADFTRKAAQLLRANQLLNESEE